MKYNVVNFQKFMDLLFWRRTNQNAKQEIRMYTTENEKKVQAFPRNIPLPGRNFPLPGKIPVIEHIPPKENEEYGAEW